MIKLVGIKKYGNQKKKFPLHSDSVCMESMFNFISMTSFLWDIANDIAIDVMLQNVASHQGLFCLH